MRTTIKIILLTLFMIFSLFIGKVNADSNIEFSIESKEGVKAGDTVSFIIRMDNVSEQDKKPVGIKLDVYYEKDLLEFVSAEKKDVANGSIDLNQDYPEEGRIRIGVVSISAIKNSGELYAVTFKVKNDITKNEAEVRLEINELIDADDNEIPYTVKNGIIKFEGVQVQNTSQQNDEQENENVQNTEGVEGQETGNLTLTSGESKNIKDIIKEKYPDMNVQGQLTWKVENPEILEIDDQGNIIQKKEGTTNVEVTDEEGNTKTIPITISSVTSNTDEAQEPNQVEADDSKNIVILVVGIIIAIIIVVIIIIIIIKKKRKKI